MEAFLQQLWDGNDDMGDGVGELLLSLQQLVTTPQHEAPARSTAPTTSVSTPAFEAAARELAGLLSGSGSPFAAFQRSTSNGASPAAAASTAAPTGAGSLLSRAFVSDSLADLLQPVAQSRSVAVDQLAAALQQARSALSAPDLLDDLFGGVDLGRFLSGDRNLLRNLTRAVQASRACGGCAARQGKGCGARQESSGLVRCSLSALRHAGGGGARVQAPAHRVAREEALCLLGAPERGREALPWRRLPSLCEPTPRPACRHQCRAGRQRDAVDHRRQLHL